MFDQEMENQRLKEDWISALLELMKQLKEWTVKQILEWEKEPGRIIPNVIETTTEKVEEHLGRYFAPMLVITAENYLVEIRPVGRFAFGPVGRVDMTNNKAAFTFIYSKKKGWVCMENRKPLTEDLYTELLNQLS